MIKIRLSFLLFLLVALFSGFILDALKLLLVILVHELGHIIMILFTKQKIKMVEITGLGCFIELKYFEVSLLEKFLIYSGGLLFTGLLMIFINKDTLIYQYNLLILLINLIPIQPLDGFQILNLTLSYFYEDEYVNDCIFYLGLLSEALLIILVIMFKVTFLSILTIFLGLRLFKYRKNRHLIILKKYLKLSF